MLLIRQELGDVLRDSQAGSPVRLCPPLLGTLDAVDQRTFADVWWPICRLLMTP